jgi:hypothetical protein
MRAHAFTPADADRWDAFCAGAFNATFLHSRRFLSYHGDRFADRSLVLEDDAGRWLGVLPAAADPDDERTVVSHPGLTYGGVLHQGALRGEAMLEAFAAAALHWRERHGHATLRYKAVPRIYHRAPADDDLYALFRLDAPRVRCDLSSTIDLAHPLPISERRRRTLRKALAAGVEVEEGAAHSAALWPVIEAVLAARHEARPVHSLAEIETLLERFPEQLRIVVARHEKRVVAGTVLFIAGPTTHTQYLASDETGHALGALDLVIDAQTRAARERGARWFDFGISNENHGRTLNHGLHRYKSEFGAGGTVHEFFELDLERAVSGAG